MNGVRIHVALNVSRFEESVAFYRSMLGADPVKLKPGYAKFSVPELPLNLTLNYDPEAKGRGALNHLGIEVPTTEQVLRARERVQNSGLAVFDEMGVDCCYALQDKVWVTDPNGYRWEIFTVKVGDTEPEKNVSLEELGARSGPACCGP
ncbi:MAG TPA: ArsI/CadI family heavy metal resistance metalloenzyme [Candidatus Acidoferrales bacterium]|nr:ArsI/CadI family heavy metal resistance metalloenzyme [Candidatus Acidoferrales bacterium]